MLADVVDRDHVRVRGEARRGPRLALEALARALVLAQVRSQQLDRHVAVQQLVVRLPYAGHPAVGEMPDHAVAVGQGDAVRGHRGHRTHGTQRPGSYTLAPMARICHSCGKRPAFGQSRSHSMVATKRRFDVNVQKVRIVEAGAPKRVYVCTRCLKAGKVTKA